MPCVISKPETQPTWNSVIKPPNFMPLQNAVLELKKLMPCRKRVNNDHVVNVCGTGLTPAARTTVIQEIHQESLAAVQWGRTQVMQRMMFAMTRVGLKVGNRNAKAFADIKDSLREDTSDSNIARICEMCCGDYEGEEAKRWSSILEDKCMRDNRLEHKCEPKNLRDKGGIEMCITKAKVDMINKVWSKKDGTSLVLSLKGETGLPAEMAADREREKMMIEKNEGGKAHRRQTGEFHLKKRVWKMMHWSFSVSHICHLTTC